jgi:hypothetical protein
MFLDNDLPPTVECVPTHIPIGAGMTEITTDVDPETESSLHPFDVLATLIIALLVPIFLGVTGGNIGLARLAAIETLDAYRARNHADLIAVAQIVAFGLAALGSLSVSLADDNSLSMTLRLRGNAIACNRAAEQNRRALTGREASNRLPTQRQAEAEPEIPPAFAEDTIPPEPDMFLNPAAARLLATEAQARLEPGTRPIPASPPAPATPRTQTEKRHQEMWAIAMAKEASEITASLPDLPPAERKTAAMRAALLSSTAHDLVYGTPDPPHVPPGALAGMSRLSSGAKYPPLSVSSA